MNRDEIIAALTELAAELQRRGTSADMYIVGGAAIALAFDERRATRDIGAVLSRRTLYTRPPQPSGRNVDCPRVGSTTRSRASSPEKTLRRPRSSICRDFVAWSPLREPCWP